MPSKLVSVAAKVPVAEALDRLAAAVERRGITVFARIDHAAGARAAGLELPDEEVLIFGDPRAGTILMQADATIGIDLPLRVLAWDDNGTTRLAYRDPKSAHQEQRSIDVEPVLARMSLLLETVIAEAIGQGATPRR